MIVINIGDYIKDVRIRKGLTSRKLAEKSGVSQPYISQLENGKNNNPSPEILKKLSETLDISYTKLMEMAGYIEEKNPLEKAIDNYSGIMDEIKRVILYKKNLDIHLQSLKERIENLNKQEEVLIFENNNIKEKLNLYNQEDQITKEHVSLLEKQINLFNQQEIIKKQQIELNHMLDSIISRSNDFTKTKENLLNALVNNKSLLEEQITISFNKAIEDLNSIS